MKARHRRFIWVGAGLAALALATVFVLRAFNSNLVFFYSPTQVLQGEAPKERVFRIGGLVKAGSVDRSQMTVRFVVSDTVKEVPVDYRGILPDLFREGKGVVAQGRLDATGHFVATEVLAKHDENYMPPEAAEAMKRAQRVSLATPESATGARP